MTHDQLVAFVAVATEGSFTLAAQRLHKSQSAISKLVRNLEAELGVLLFNRSSYRASLTDAGRTLSGRALGVLEGVRELEALGRALAGSHEAVVRVAIDAITPLYLVLDVLRSVGKKYADVRLELSTEHMGGAVEALEEGRVELAITSRLEVDPRRIESEPFTRVAIVPVAHRDHPVARASGPVPASLLQKHPQIVLSDSAQRDLSPAINVLEGGVRWNVSDVAAKKQIIVAGMGWGGLPRHLVARELSRGTLVELRVREFHADAIALGLVRRRDRITGVVAQTLWAGLLEAVRDAAAHARRPGRLEPSRERRAKAPRAR
jgi:DNA-binding transcriptional LysR family regulator